MSPRYHDTLDQIGQLITEVPPRRLGSPWRPGTDLDDRNETKTLQRDRAMHTTHQAGRQGHEAGHAGMHASFIHSFIHFMHALVQAGKQASARRAGARAAIVSFPPFSRRAMLPSRKNCSFV